MKKTLFMWMVLAIFIFAGCDNSINDNNSQFDQDDLSGLAVISELAEKSLDKLQSDTTDAGAVCAVAYLGWLDADYNDFSIYLKENGFIEQYPFLLNLSAENVVLHEGCEWYIVLPVDNNVSIKVNELIMDDSDDYLPDPGREMLSIKNGAAILLRGNISEIVPNLLLTVQRQDCQPVEYSPCLSMMDGSLCSDDNIYDFTPYQLLEQLR